MRKYFLISKIPIFLYQKITSDIRKSALKSYLAFHTLAYVLIRCYDPTVAQKPAKMHPLINVSIVNHEWNLFMLKMKNFYIYALPPKCHSVTPNLFARWRCVIIPSKYIPRSNVFSVFILLWFGYVESYQYMHVIYLPIILRFVHWHHDFPVPVK